MGLFRRKKDKPLVMTPREALEARPIRLVEAEVVRNEDGSGKLTVPLQAEQLGFWGRLFRVPEGATKTFELDTVGLFVWDQLDGRTSVQSIAKALSREYRLDIRAAEVSTATFLKMLVRRGLIGVPVDSTRPSGRKTA